MPSSDNRSPVHSPCESGPQGFTSLSGLLDRPRRDQADSSSSLRLAIETRERRTHPWSHGSSCSRSDPTAESVRTTCRSAQPRSVAWSRPYPCLPSVRILPLLRRRRSGQKPQLRGRPDKRQPLSQARVAPANPTSPVDRIAADLAGVCDALRAIDPAHVDPLPTLFCLRDKSGNPLAQLFVVISTANEER